MKQIKGHLDLFSGIGGFSLALKRCGVHPNWIGFSDIDKFANKLFKRRFPNANRLGSVTNVSYKSIGRRISLLTGGFPCQSFSLAGKRGGFEDTRGTLFFEIARILREYRDKGTPIPCFVLENVKGLYSSGDYSAFPTIYGVLTDLGYTVEVQLLNTRWFLPQNRERVYFVGHFGKPSGQKIFPIGQSDGEIKKKRNIQAYISNASEREFGFKDVSPALCARDYKEPKIVKVADYRNNGKLKKVGDLQITVKKRVYDTPKEINQFLKDNKGNYTINQIADKLKLPKTQVEHYFRTDKSRAIPTPKVWIKLKEILKFNSLYCKQVTDIYEKDMQFESTRRVYSSDGASPTLDTSKKGSLIQVADYSIRRLTPIECERLQGFPDNWTDGQSDTQRYKQCGNAITVNVAEEIFKRLYKC